MDVSKSFPLLVALMALVGGCLFTPPGPRRPREPLDYPRDAPIPLYSIEAVNEQKQMLEDVDVRFGYPQIKGQNPAPTFGFLGPEKEATDNFIPVPIPHRVRVSWRTPDGQLHLQEVQVIGFVPQDFSGVIQFIFAPDGTVRVGTRPLAGRGGG